MMRDSSSEITSEFRPPKEPSTKNQQLTNRQINLAPQDLTLSTFMDTLTIRDIGHCLTPGQPMRPVRLKYKYGSNNQYVCEWARRVARGCRYEPMFEAATFIPTHRMNHVVRYIREHMPRSTIFKVNEDVRAMIDESIAAQLEHPTTSTPTRDTQVVRQRKLTYREIRARVLARIREQVWVKNNCDEGEKSA